ncbi:hypothetical protein GQ457_01G030400 [Hibiscus cannabinus]
MSKIIIFEIGSHNTIPNPRRVTESDLVVAVSWVLYLERRPWKYWRWFQQIDDLCARLLCVCFHHVFRKANSVADSLAKGGVGRPSWFQLMANCC